MSVPSTYLHGISSKISPGNRPNSIAFKHIHTLRRKLEVELMLRQKGYIQSN